MKSIFNEADKKELIERVNLLTSETKHEWGKMNVSQMLVHCTVSIKLAFGEIKPELIEEYIKMGKLVKEKVLETEVFSKNLPTSKEFLVSDSGNFELNKNTLTDYLNKFSAINQDSEKTEPNPFLGNLNMREWGVLIWKHTNHHLLQFGV